MDTIRITLDKLSASVLFNADSTVKIHKPEDGKAFIEMESTAWSGTEKNPGLFERLAARGLVAGQTVYNPHELNLVLREAK